MTFSWRIPTIADLRRAMERRRERRRTQSGVSSASSGSGIGSGISSGLSTPPPLFTPPALFSARSPRRACTYAAGDHDRPDMLDDPSSASLETGGSMAPFFGNFAATKTKNLTAADVAFF